MLGRRQNPEVLTCSSLCRKQLAAGDREVLKSLVLGREQNPKALTCSCLGRRQLAAGDQLRVIYENLSKDPNSLANLDQDLPNYSQHQVRAPPPTPVQAANEQCGDETILIGPNFHMCKGSILSQQLIARSKNCALALHRPDENFWVEAAHQQVDSGTCRSPTQAVYSWFVMRARCESRDWEWGNKAVDVLLCRCPSSACPRNGSGARRGAGTPPSTPPRPSTSATTRSPKCEARSPALL